jgi:hypothetical protein
VSAAITRNSSHDTADAVPKSPSEKAIRYMNIAVVMTDGATPLSASTRMNGSSNSCRLPMIVSVTAK